MTKSLISVVIPYYHAKEFISEAIASVRAQNYPYLEILLVDDGSRDGIAERAQAFGSDIVLLEREHAGPAAARNTALKTARGEFIAFLDADDIWPEGKLAAQLAYLDAYPEMLMVGGKVRMLTMREIEPGLPWFPELPPKERPTVFLGAYLMRREAIQHVGHFDEELHFHEDVDWFLRAYEDGFSLPQLSRETLIHRIHENNMMRGATLENTSYLKMIKRSVDRQRQRKLADGFIIPH